ncbi:MAG: glycosyltransferase family 2 protein [Candidatus Omnitrophica bacterium]|nr:glycosyltransferase family 2 protein [Candidatus Omnitrophota bacterium]
MKLSIVMPAYNEAENIPGTVQEIRDIIVRTKKVTDYEIIIADDHSSDGTFDIVKEMSGNNVRCVRLSRRGGSHIAIRAGLGNSSGDAVLCMSADGQENPSCLNEMLDKWEKGAGVVWGLRKDRATDTWHIRKTAQVFYAVLSWMTGTEYRGIDLSRADFFLLDRKAVDAMGQCREKNTSIFGLIAWIGFDQDLVEYERRYRKAGKSKWSFKSRLSLAKDWIFAFSELPLFVMMIFGFFMVLSGGSYGVLLAVKKFGGDLVPGWEMVLAASVVLSGIQMGMIGVAGEYIWRNLDESRKRPLYFIEKETGGAGKKRMAG